MKNDKKRKGGQLPRVPAARQRHGPLAQRSELLPHKQLVPGSSPGRPTSLARGITFLVL